jgi:hypothetical protein
MLRGYAERSNTRAYLDALESHKPRRGRQRTPESIRKQLAQVESELRGATGFQKLELVARRMELQGELASKQGRSDLTALRKSFVRHAGKYASRKGIPKQAFQEAGVPPASGGGDQVGGEIETSVSCSSSRVRHSAMIRVCAGRYAR